MSYGWLLEKRVHYQLEELRPIGVLKATARGPSSGGSLQDAMMPLLPDDVLTLLGLFIGPVAELMIKNEMLGRTLAGIHDLFFPKLLSGEICFRDFKAVGESVT